jgi:hypothetical protein
MSIIAAGVIGFATHKRMEYSDLKREYDTWHSQNRSPVMNFARMATSHLYPQPPDPHVALINAVKEVELAKMTLPITEKQSERNTTAQVEVTKLQTKAQVETARWTAMGQAGALDLEWEREKEKRQWEADQAKEERDWKSSEAEKDRQLTIDQLITKFEGQIREIEIRLTYEKPDAASRSTEEMIRLRGRLAQLQEINKLRETDPVLHRQLFEQFRRGFN